MTHFVRTACTALALQCAFVPSLMAQQVNALASAPAPWGSSAGRVAQVPGLAQSRVAADVPEAPPKVAPRDGPTLEAVRAGVTVVDQPRDAQAMTVTQGRRGIGHNVALMAVGGAALLTGLIIGDDAGTLIAVGGAVVGLYGLYNYLK